MNKISFILATLLFVNSVVISAHSWLDCVNVTNPLTVTSLADIKCNGYPRGYVGRSVPDDNMWKIEGITQAQFLATNACRWTTKTYSSTYPMIGPVTAGESMTIGYTPNGHTTWASTAPPRGPQNFTVRWSGVAGSDLQTMQDVINAPSLLTVQFDTPCHSRVTGAQLDAASGICQADVTIPKGTPAGTYQLVWWWPFRYASATVIEDYTTCWDVTVVASASGTTTTGSSTTGSSTTAKSTTGSTTTSATTTTTTTGSASTTGSSSTTTYSDLIIVSQAPSTVISSGSFNVIISYVASASRDIVVDLMDSNESWYGKGIATVAAGKGAITIAVAVQNSPAQSSNYQLHAWIVGAGQADVTNAWNSAYDNDYKSLSVGSSLVTSC